MPIAITPDRERDNTCLSCSAHYPAMVYKVTATTRIGQAFSWQLCTDCLHDLVQQHALIESTKG